MASFFPRTFQSDTSFTPLFRLLDDFDTYSRQSGTSSSGRRSTIHFQPKFDVRETGEAYELHGELPGVTKENVQIEFTDPQTMLIRGRAERTYTAGTPPAGVIDTAPAKAAITEGEQAKNNNSHHATVEDDNEAQGDWQAVAKQPEGNGNKAEEKTKSADKAKYWLSERSIGEFSRTFNFPGRVDQDAVSASFSDGILNVSVPKAKKHETRRIQIN
jgi:HSP20 family molecular chaperone IbpA